MKTSQDNTENLIREYMNSEGIEKAPEGFTAKIMSRIQVEPATGRNSVKESRLRLVPLVSVAVVLMLVVMALILPDNNSMLASGPAADFLKKVSLMLPSIDMTSHLKVNIPATFIYISIAIFMLTFFDRALNGIFHRDK
ncbi:MAG TPA: hypothetical protein VJ963_15525 [Bacteroidales bacterium]|nr:hypothetical protein [Bacteroidales bacterium]